MSIDRIASKLHKKFGPPACGALEIWSAMARHRFGIENEKQKGNSRRFSQKAGWIRMRTGDYRRRFRVEDDRIVVAKIGHRRDFYDE